ncbi:MAG: O-antigen ligase family protein [Acidobacteria bacterium]|nr:O-antigen ligase family protein [Acidobacteriota bacterium]
MRSLSTVETGLAARPAASEAVFRGSLLAVIAVAPLLILPGVFFHFDVTPKILALLAGTAIALWFWRPEGRAGASREMHWLRRLLGLQAMSLVASTLLSADRSLSLTGANWRRFGLVTQLTLLLYIYLLSRYLSGGNGHRLERVNLVLRVLAASGIAAALYGIAQYFGWDPWLPAPAYHVGEGPEQIVRPPGPLGHAGYFSAYLLAVTFAGLALLGTEKNHSWRWIGWAAAALAAAAILLSGTRGAMLGLGAGAAVLALRAKSRLSARRLIAAAAVLAGFILFYVSPAGLLLRSRTRWFLEDPYGGGRLRLWADTLRMAAPRPLAGYGPETFSSEFPRFQSEALARQFPDRYYESPHNVVLDALAGQGAPGLILLVLLAGLGLWAGRRDGPRPDALAAGLAATLVGNLFLSFTLPTALVFCLLVAALCALPDGAKPPALSRFPRLLPQFTALLLLAAACSLGWSDFWLARVRQALEAGNLEQGMRHYRRILQFKPPGVDTDLWYSRALYSAASKTDTEPVRRQAWQEAFAAARRAAQTSEQRPNAYYNLAAFYAVQNDFAGAEQSLRAAIAWAPRWFKPHWMLAQVLEQAGRSKEAEGEARRAVELDASKDSAVTQTWQRIRARIPAPANAGAKKQE